ncbi:MAG: hypothetical protein AAFV25_04405 [Bacteroidota bacterium]
MKFPLLLLLLCFCSLSLSAQTANLQALESINLTADDLNEITPNSWSFYADEENQLYYVDFEAINVNINDVTIRNDRNEVVFREKVLDLPVDTIYEIDFSQYGAGAYKIELRSFTSIIKKEVEIK